MKKEFTMKSVVTLWLNKSKDGTKTYLSGKTEEGARVIGFIQGKKKNPKEPDIRFFHIEKEGEEEKLVDWFAVWVNVSKNGKKYAAGKIDGKKVVGFFNSKAVAGGNIPYLNIYESEEAPKQEEKQEAMAEVTEDLPF